MLQNTIQIVKSISERTKKIILFHSAAGKDSIALLDLCAPYFDEIVCVFMYIVKDLEHIEKYIRWAELKYPNVKFIQHPHYVVYSHIRDGYMGIKQNTKQKLFKLSDINNFAVENTGIEWTFFGFKQSDSLNRRIMLRTYDHQAINEKSKKVYPLSIWKNRDVKKYIDIHGLIQPIIYDKLAQSQGTDICDINFLLWCQKYYPNDLKKIFAIFPNAEQIIFEYKYHEQYKTIGDGND